MFFYEGCYKLPVPMVCSGVINLELLSIN